MLMSIHIILCFGSGAGRMAPVGFQGQSPLDAKSL